MDDFSLTSLKESRNEWCIQLIQKLSPAIVAGLVEGALKQEIEL